MKYSFLLSTLFFFILFGCSNNSSDNEETFEGYMQAKINGELVLFPQIIGVGHWNSDLGCIEPYHEIYGVKGVMQPDGVSIHLHFSPSQGVGTYNPKAYYQTWTDYANSRYNQIHYCPDDDTQYEEAGSVTITSTDNNRYKGIFNFTASDECGDTVFLITEGEFEIDQKVVNSCD